MSVPPHRATQATVQLGRNPQTAVALVGFATFLFGYPIAIDAAAGTFGPRGVAGLVLAAALASGAFLGGRRRDWMPQVSGVPKIGLLVLLVLAIVTDERIYLRWIVPLVYLGLAMIFRDSLRVPGSIIESLIRTIEAAAPDFVRPYCRKLTALWAGFFLANAALMSALLLAAPLEWWSVYTGRIVYALMLVLSAAEFLVRKTWFRYYFYGGPFDRLWSRLFPADATEAGRRSADYIRRVKDELEA